MQNTVAGTTALSIAGRGNAGPVESVEKQRQLSHSFHRPLEISQKARDSHISTARRRDHGKVENQKQVSHFPTAARNYYCCLSTTQKPKKGSRPLRGLLIPPIPFSLRSNGTDFMLILQLENAGSKRLSLWYSLPSRRGSESGLEREAHLELQPAIIADLGPRPEAAP